MTRGLKKKKFRDHRRYDYQRTFGGFTGEIPDFNVDPQVTNPNQNLPDASWPREALYNGCTGFAVANIAETELKKPVDPAFSYAKGLIEGNAPDGSPLVMQDTFKGGTVYGVRLQDETDAQALTHRRSPYFEVRPTRGQDWFDALLTATYTNQRPTSVGTTWPIYFESGGNDGVQTYLPKTWVGGHCHNIVGKKTIDGVEYLIDKSWNGPHWGDGGYSYFSREIINATMKIPGSDALTNREARPQDIVRVKITILQLLISLYYRLLTNVGSWKLS